MKLAPLTGVALGLVSVILSVLCPASAMVEGVNVFCTVGALNGVKVTWAVSVNVMLSVTSRAEYVMGPSSTASVTVNVATPEALVVPETVLITELPEPAVSCTTLPETPFEAPSFSETVMVEALVPLAATDVGLESTVELAVLMASTLRLAEALPGVPLTVFKSVGTLALVGRTTTVTTQEPLVAPCFLGTVAPLRPKDVPPALAVRVPPQLFVVCRGVAFTKLPG